MDAARVAKEQAALQAHQQREEKLELACQAGDYDLVVKMLRAEGAGGRSAGGAAGAGRRSGRTLLHAAAAGGNERVLRTLLDAGAGADLEVRLGGEWSQQLTPLQVAVSAGHAAAAKILVGAGADTSGALLTAIRRGHEQLAFDLLLSSGGGRSNGGSSGDEFELPGWVLIDACSKGYDHLVRALLQREGPEAASSFSAMGNTALHAAARGGHASTAAVVIATGLDVNAFTWRGETPLHLAGESGSAATVEALVAAGAGVGLRHPTLGNGSTPLHVAAREGHAGASLALLRHGADPCAADNSGHQPLHLAARGGHAEACLALLRHGADVLAADGAGRQPLHGACERLHSGVMRLLLRWGADEAAADGDGTAARDRIPTEEEIERGAALYHLDSSQEERDARDEYVRQVSRDRDHALAVVAQAPRDRAWRRRGVLVLVRARAERRRLDVTAGAAAGAAAAAGLFATDGAHGRVNNAASKLLRQESAGAAGGTGGVPRGTGCAVCGLDAAARLVDVQEEGIFRHVVAFL